MKTNIILIGGGGHCRSLIDVIEAEGSFTIAGIIDQKERIGEKVLGYEIIGCDEDLEKIFNDIKHAIVAVGQVKSPDIRINIWERIKKIGFKTPTIVSPRAYVSKHAKIGIATVIMHDALVNANAIVGDNCIINSKALIEHDSQIANNCHISTGAIVNGGTIICEGTFFGSNAVAKESITIAAKSFIKAGSLVK